MGLGLGGVGFHGRSLTYFGGSGFLSFEPRPECSFACGNGEDGQLPPDKHSIVFTGTLFACHGLS